MIVLADIEANGLNPTVIHCIVVKPLGGKRITFTSVGLFKRWVEENDISKWVFHSGLGYDVPVINKLIAPDLIKPEDVIDTFVVSRLVDYMKFNTHSLKELGEYLKVYKGDYTGGWEVCTPEMIEYCEQDVEVLEAIFNYYKRFIFDAGWAKAMRVEHDTAIICQEMSANGFQFNKTNAEILLEEIKTEMSVLEDAFSTAFPPTLVEKTRLKYRKKKDGTLFKNVEEAISKYPSSYVSGEELVCLDYEEFNPGSPKQRIDKLWEAGWNPTDKTDGHKKYLRENSRWNQRN